MAERYPMQAADRELDLEDALHILDNGQYAVISTVDPDGSPYGVPMSYAMLDGRMLLHTSKGPGHKFDDFEHDDRVSVNVAMDLEAVYEDAFFTTRFASVIANGRIFRIEDPVLARKALVALCMKYLPEFKDEIGGAIEREWDATSIWAIDFDEIRGKAGRWLNRPSRAER